MMTEDLVQVTGTDTQLVVSVPSCGIVVRAPNVRSAVREVLGRIARVRAEFGDTDDGSERSSPEYWKNLEREVKERLFEFAIDGATLSPDGSSSAAFAQGDHLAPSASGNWVGRPRLAGSSMTSIIVPVVIAALAPWFILTLILVVVLAPLASTLSAVPSALVQIKAAARGDVSSVGSEGAVWLTRVGDTFAQITPERRQQLREATRKIVDFLAPIVAETKPLFSDMPQATSGQLLDRTRSDTPRFGGRVPANPARENDSRTDTTAPGPR